LNPVTGAQTGGRVEKECGPLITDGEAAQRRAALWRRRLEREAELGLRHGAETDFHSLRAKWTAMAAVGLLKAVRFYARGRHNACSPRLTDLTFAYPNLPPDLDGFRILQLSDFHFRSKDHKFTRAVCDLLRGVEADCCVLTGDYAFGYYGPQDFVLPHLKQVLEVVRAPRGIFAILGNHDISDLVPGLRALGITVLINEGLSLRIGKADLWMAGVDDPHKFRADSLALALDGAPPDAFKVLLAHTPECISEAATHGADLYLCGHTHGGQIRLPIVGAVLLNARCPRRHAMGRWRNGAMQGYTTVGMGSTDIPVRYLCPPEAARITLRRA